MRVKMAEPLPQPTANTTVTSRGLTSLEANKKAKVASGGARVQTKMISLVDIQAKKALELIAQQEKAGGGKRKAGAAAATAAATAAASTTSASATAPTAAAAAAAAAAAVAGSGPSSSTVTLTVIASTAAAAEAANPDKANNQASPPSSTPLEQPGPQQPVLDYHALFAESPLLTDEDKTVIINFFSSSNPYPESTPNRRMKLSETDTADGTGRESQYLVLRFSDKTYQRTRKLKANK